jgi:hypothetical protein
MFWKKKYIFPNDYELFIEGLFEICKLNNQKIHFTEVCTVNKQQLCIKISVKMLKLLSNKNGQLFFEGKCKELGKNRIFELIMPEYKIDGQYIATEKWFLEITGKSTYMFKTELTKKKSKQLWTGCSPITNFTDVFTVIENGKVLQKTLAREVNILEIFLDGKNKFYIKAQDLITNEICETYVEGLNFKTASKHYDFFDWCKEIINLELLDYLPRD